MEPEQRETEAPPSPYPHGKLAHNAKVSITIYFRPPGDENTGYLSAYTNYPARIGEDWHRGNDLSDGSYSKETLERIIADIREVFSGRKL